MENGKIGSVSAIKHAYKCFITLAITKQCFSFPTVHRAFRNTTTRKTLAAVCRSTASAACKHWMAAARV